MAQNPEWTNKITGGTLATMIANNYKNQNAFTQFLGAQQTAQYAAQQGASAYNTQALLSGITGGAALGAQNMVKTSTDQLALQAKAYTKAQTCNDNSSP